MSLLRPPGHSVTFSLFFQLTPREPAQYHHDNSTEKKTTTHPAWSVTATRTATTTGRDYHVYCTIGEPLSLETSGIRIFGFGFEF